jgi:hypothetical protein
MCKRMERFIHLFGMVHRNYMRTLSVYAQEDGYTEAVMYIPYQGDKLIFTCHNGYDVDSDSFVHKHWMHRT